MSINITVHGSPSKRYTKTRILLDPEGNKKRLLEERRKLRLEQVRQKSKEFASQVRKNVDNEKQKQLKKIEQIKKDELKNWKKSLKNKLNDTVPEIGEAHRAAKKDLNSSNAIFYNTNSKESLDLIPSVPTKIDRPLKKNIQIKNSENKENSNLNVFRKHSYPEVIIEKSAENTVSSYDEMPTKKCLKKFEKLDLRNNTKQLSKLNSNDNIRHDNQNYKSPQKDKSKISKSSINEPPFKSYASFKERMVKKQNENLKKTPSIIMSLGSSDTSLSSSTSSLEIQDIHDETNQHFSRIYSKNKKDMNVKNCNSKSFSEQKEPTIKSSRTKFTQISDFLSKNTVSNRITERNEGSSSLESESRTNVFKTLHTKPSNEVLLEKSNETLKNRVTGKMSEKPEIRDQLNSENSNNTQKSHSSKISNRQPIFVRNSNTSIKTYTVEHKKSGIQLENEFSSKTDMNDVIKSYDYNNRFQKNINPVRYATVISDKVLIEPSAVENADIERQLQKSRDNELEIIKRKTEERGQKALEREKVRRDYEMLESKLEALTKDKQLNGFYSNARETVSEAQIKHMENERINKINKSIENVIKRPVVITLPEVNYNHNCHNPTVSDSQFEKDYLTKGVNLANIGEDSGTINSTDSCCSILLNYVDNQTKQINNDIRKSDTNQKTAKLKLLLNKLEILRENLLKELEKSEKLTKNKNIQTMFDSITDLREEREKILLLNTEKKDLEKREKVLIKREAILEQKLKEFYDMKNSKSETAQNKKHKTSHEKQAQGLEKSAEDNHSSNEPSIESFSQNEANQDESSECIDKKVVPVDKPLEIVIKVKETKQKTPYKAIRKKASLYQKDIPFRKKYNFQKNSTPVRVINNSDFTTSTEYKSPPETMRTKLDAFMQNEKTIKQNEHLEKHDKYETSEICKEKNSKELKYVKDNAESAKIDFPVDRPKKTNSNTACKAKTDNEKSVIKELQKKEIGTKKYSKNTKNPVLAQYIQRLLGMSRHSINMLGVSSSDIQTPNSSVVNVPNNISATNLDNDQDERIKRIQNFIDDNYSFVNEIEETLKREEKSACESEESIRLIEEIWKKSLKHKTKITKQKNSEPPKPILKKKIKKKKNEINDKIESLNKKQNEPSEEEQVLERYTKLTENCTQRISELNEMIERVRKEKQKILEITLSSNGSGNSKTEYLDFMGKSKIENRKELTKEMENDKNSAENLNKNAEKQKLSNCVPPINSIPVTPVKEPYDSVERVQLEKNKLTGVSRDSGISLSRPLTAQDNRDSPDVREEIHFEPLLKDIPKPNSINITKPTVINMASISITKEFSAYPNTYEQQSIKKNKPPVSISRYSPQLVEDIPHELSTILEIDTPATSRLNVTLKDTINPLQKENIVEGELQQKQHEIVSTTDETHEFNIDFEKYPSFEDYAKAHNMDIVHFDAEKSAYIKKLYEELFELTHSVDINLKKFPSINSFKNKENSGNGSKTDNESLINLSKELALKKFLTPKEYFKRIGATDLLDSKSLIENSQSKSSTLKNHHPSDDESSDEEFSKQWCLKKFPELKEYLKKTGISNITTDSLEKTMTNKNQTKDKVTNLTKTDSGESLPDVNAELKRRNIIEHSFKNEIFVSNSDPKTSSNSDLVAGSSSSKENKDPTLYIKAKSTGDISGIGEMGSTYSSNDLGKEFEEMGLKWASLMLKKQQQSNALSSSTSSSFVFQKREKKSSTSRVLKNSTLKSKKNFSHEEIKTEHDSSIDTNVSEKCGKPLNLREFLAQELQKRTNSSSTESTSLTDDSLAGLFLRSLLGSATPSPKTINGNDIVGASSDRQQKTSTPVLFGLSSSSRKSTSSIDSNGIKLFSGESRISSVRFNNESSASNDDQNKNLKSNKNSLNSNDSIKK